MSNRWSGAPPSFDTPQHLIENTPTRRHDRREQHWRQWAKLGNVPEAHADTLGALGRARPSARYGDAAVSMTPEQVRAHLDVVSQMLSHATEQIGEGLPDHQEAVAKFKTR
jgi:hypothetical protein